MMSRRTFIAATAAATTANPAAATSPFTIPAEEHAHERTFMQWPVSRKVHPSAGFLQDTQATIVNIANTIADFEPVVMLAHKDDHANIRAQTSELVELWDIPTEDLWAPDAGPCFAQNGKIQRIHNFNSNGWAIDKSTNATAKSPPLWHNASASKTTTRALSVNQGR